MPEKIEEYTLHAGSELRFEIDAENENVVLELKSGYAEMFGTELIKGIPFEFGTGSKVGIFTFHGCVLKVKGNPDVIYISKETPMNQYLNIHSILEELRFKAKSNNSHGPVIMIAGSKNSGRTTLCKILSNYAVRLNWSPIYVDLDPSQASFVSIPGTIGALCIERTSPVGEDFCNEDPLVYHYGHMAPKDNVPLFKKITSELANTTLRALQYQKKASGIIIDTYGDVKNTGYYNFIHAVSVFKVELVCVINQERLSYDLQQDLPAGVQIINLPKSMGVVEKTEDNRIEFRRLKIKEYFYGRRIPLYPHLVEIKWKDFMIYKIYRPELPESGLPFGFNFQDNDLKLIPVKPAPNLLYHILGVSFGKTSNDNLLDSNVAGFVLVTKVDIMKETVTVLSPQPRIQPRSKFLLSQFQYVE